MSITLWYTATLSFILIKFIYWFVFYRSIYLVSGASTLSSLLVIKDEKISCTTRKETIDSYLKSKYCS